MSPASPVALITGASMGLGAEISRQLAHCGNRLILTARGADALGLVAAGVVPAGVPGLQDRVSP